MSGFQYARTLYDNDSEHQEELSFQKGEILVILSTDIDGASGWWFCKKGSKLGIAPGNFLEKLPSTFTPLLPLADPKLDKVAADRSSRAPSGEYARPRNPKMYLGEGESQLNVHHRQVEEAYNRLNNHYSNDVLKCDEYDLMKWGSVTKHFWTLSENFSSSVLLFSKFIRVSILETIDENVDFVVVGKLSNKLNNLDHDYQGLLSLFKITKLILNENTSKNVTALMDRVEKLPSQVNEIFATLKANKNMFFTEEAPKWAKKGRQSYEDVDCMDFLTQAVEIRNRNEVNLDAKVSHNSVPSSPNHVVEPGSVQKRSRSKSDSNQHKLSLPATNTFLKSRSHSGKTEVEPEKKRSFSISQSISKLKIKKSPGEKYSSSALFKSTKRDRVNKIDISSPSNPQKLQSVTSDFSMTKARAVTMATPENSSMTSSPDLSQSKHRVRGDSCDDITAESNHARSLPLTPGEYEPMKTAVSNSLVPDRAPVTLFNSAPKQKSGDVSLLTELYLQLEQVGSDINTSAQNLRSHLSSSTHDPLVYIPIVQNLVTHIYKCVFLIEAAKPKISNNFYLDKSILNLTTKATSLIRQCQESLKMTPFNSKISAELVRMVDNLTNEMLEVGRCVMELRDDSMSSSEI